MATAAAEIFNRQTTAQTFSGKSVAPMASSTNAASGTTGSSDGSSSGATISANDFLTLLVTEMKNQDPTANTDPNEYISQLVQVNSLEQLIDINQKLTTNVSNTTASSNNGPTGKALGEAGGSVDTSAGRVAGTTRNSGGVQTAHITAGNTSSLGSSALQSADGNLSVPAGNRAAQRVSHALDGRTRGQPAV